MGPPPARPLLSLYLHDEFAARHRPRMSLPLALFVVLVGLVVALIVWSVRQP